MPGTEESPETDFPEVNFTARVRKDHRIAIPEACRAAGGINETDLVSVRLRRVAEAQGASR